jgi:hypothetical protein
MEFGIGFVAGCLVAGVVVGKWGSLLKTLHQMLSKAIAAVEHRIAVGVAGLKAKL